MVLQSLWESMSLPIFSNPGPLRTGIFFVRFRTFTAHSRQQMTRPYPTAILFFLLLASFPFRLTAIPADTLKPKHDSTKVFWFTQDLDRFGKLNLKPFDTAVAGTQVYDPEYKYSRFYANLGVMGSASSDLLPDSYGHASGFDYGNHSFDPYLFKNDSVRYYKVLKTFSQLTYEQGSKRSFCLMWYSPGTSIKA